MNIQWRTSNPPKEESTYLVTLEGGEIATAVWTNASYFGGGTPNDWHWVGHPQYSRIVAWMPLPVPYSNSEKDPCVEVKTRGGTLRAEATTDPDNPGIWITYRPNDGEVFWNVCLVENTDRSLVKDKEKADARNLRVFVWNNPEDEDYETGPITIEHDDIDQAWF